jgi:hypothetical protein
VAERTASLAVNLHRSYGCVKDYPVQKALSRREDRADPAKVGRAQLTQKIETLGYNVTA